MSRSLPMTVQPPTMPAARAASASSTKDFMSAVSMRFTLLLEIVTSSLQAKIGCGLRAFPLMIQHHCQTAQFGAEIASQILGQGRDDALARGRLPTFSTEFDDQRIQHKLLNQARLVANDSRFLILPWTPLPKPGFSHFFRVPASFADRLALQFPKTVVDGAELRVDSTSC